MEGTLGLSASHPIIGLLHDVKDKTQVNVLESSSVKWIKRSSGSSNGVPKSIYALITQY